MRWLIEDLPVEPGIIGPPAMNFGQHHRWKDLPSLPYRCELSLEEFVGHIEEPFAGFRACELGEEEDNGEEVLIAYREAGFPELSALLTDNRPLLSEVVRWLDLDLLNSMSVARVAGAPLYYSVNSLDSVHFTANKVVLEGIAYACRPRS